MRGKVDLSLKVVRVLGITPACAGKRCFLIAECLFVGDHPRVCGEKGSGMLPSSVPLGSPPRMRGKARGAGVGYMVCGITPACAGKSSHQHGAGRWRRDHPRVCGEKAVAHIWWYSWIGSPPRVRGKENLVFCHFGAGGITPACAGKSVTVMAPS